MPTPLRALIIACTFLTRLPMPAIGDYQPADSGRALPMFPFVGLIIGLLIAAFSWLLIGNLDTGIIAALTLAVWILLTGALHLDGLGDSADGWLCGGDKERTLQVMKDPRSGSAAIVVIGIIMLIKFSAIQVIVTNQQLWTLLLTPVLARACALLLLMTTDYVSRKGIAEDFLTHSSPSQMRLSVIAAVVMAFLVAPIQVFLMVIIAISITFWALRALMVKRLGGVTGDTSGATIEIIEAVVLIAALIR